MALLGRIDFFDLKRDNTSEYWKSGTIFYSKWRFGWEKANCHLLNCYSKWNVQLVKKFASTKITGRENSKNAIWNINKPPETPAHNNCWALLFYCRDQSENESITEHLADLRKLTLSCDFKDFLDQAFRDRFVCGLHNNSIRRRLLAKRKLNLKSVIELAKAMENTNLETQIISTDIKTENVNPMNNATWKCYRCNSTKQLANVCRFKDAKCNNCHMKGHISKTCRNKSATENASISENCNTKANF